MLEGIRKTIQEGLFFLSRLVRRPRYVVVMGASGSGKGTLCSDLCPALGIAQLSSGDVLRRHVAEKTAIGLAVQDYVRQGKLAPPELVMSAIRQELLRPKFWAGAVLDGIPRTAEQARAFGEMFASWGVGVEHVILLDVPADVLVERLSNRRTCKTCNKIYHLRNNPPGPDGTCKTPGCPGPLYQREDDVPAAIANRLQFFHAGSQAIVDYYTSQGIKLTRLKATASTKPKEIATAAIKALGQ